MRSPGRAVSLHLARSGSQSEHKILLILPAGGACHVISIYIYKDFPLSIPVRVVREKRSSMSVLQPRYF